MKYIYLKYFAATNRGRSRWRNQRFSGFGAEKNGEVSFLVYEYMYLPKSLRQTGCDTSRVWI